MVREQMMIPHLIWNITGGFYLYGITPRIMSLFWAIS